ncbi:hypothetical protein ACK1MN_003746 [Salmonella enterica]|nr:hypothetical protein [Salmonella enterica]EJF5594668.1 hypothetical protein [Salmonella enterica]EJF5825833.1 hypothetical protein [Salmonella enterica]EJF5844545.1 hypothetical protein [Salmonella enterica]EJF5917022.1 hypothetical protein [Salmonella enterica]
MMKASCKKNLYLLPVFALTTFMAHSELVNYYGAATWGGGIVDGMEIKEKNILEFSIPPDVKLFCYPPPHVFSPLCRSNSSMGERAYAEGYRLLDIKSEDPDITFPDLTRLPSGTYVYQSNEYRRFEPMMSWSNSANICDTRGPTACFVYSPTDTYRLRISATGKKDGIYTSTFEVGTYYREENKPIDYAGEGGFMRKGTITYRVANGSIVPPTEPISCNFSRIYKDTSGTSSDINFLHSYGDMKSGTTDSKTTMLVYSCDQSASSFTVSLIKAGISVKKTEAGADNKSQTVVDDRTGKLDVKLTGIKGPLPVYHISDNEFIIGFMSTLTAKSAGSIKYTDILVLSYD